MGSQWWKNYSISIDIEMDSILTHLIATPIARINLNITETAIKSKLMNTNARRF